MIYRPNGLRKAVPSFYDFERGGSAQLEAMSEATVRMASESRQFKKEVLQMTEKSKYCGLNKAISQIK